MQSEQMMIAYFKGTESTLIGSQNVIMKKCHLLNQLNLLLQVIQQPTIPEVVELSELQCDTVTQVQSDLRGRCGRLNCYKVLCNVCNSSISEMLYQLYSGTV